MPLRVVLDTNVLVAALRSRRGASFALLSAVGTGEFELVLSVPLLFEYEAVLKRASSGVPLTAPAIDAVLDYLCSVAVEQEIHFLWRPQLRDAADDFVLELAVAARCDYVVTFNVRDFSGSTRFGVRAATPAAVLRALRGRP